MFYDGVFDNLDGMKFIKPGELQPRDRFLHPAPGHSHHIVRLSRFSASRAVHGLCAGHRGVQGAQLQGRGLVHLCGTPSSLITAPGVRAARSPYGARRTQSKLKRTKQFYVPQFEALKALTAPEVCRNLRSRTRPAPRIHTCLYRIYFAPGTQEPQDYDGGARVVPPQARRVRVSKGRVQERRCAALPLYRSVMSL